VKKSEWKNTKIWKAKGKAMDTNTGKSPGYQSQSQLPGNLPSEEVRGHWTPTGAETMEQWMDSEAQRTIVVYIHCVNPVLQLL